MRIIIASLSRIQSDIQSGEERRPATLASYLLTEPVRRILLHLYQHVPVVQGIRTDRVGVESIRVRRKILNDNRQLVEFPILVLTNLLPRLTTSLFFADTPNWLLFLYSVTNVGSFGDSISSCASVPEGIISNIASIAAANICR